MAKLLYTRKANGEEIRLNFYADKDEYVVYKGNKIYGVADTIMAAYALYNEIK